MSIENLTKDELREVQSNYLTPDELEMVGPRLVAGVLDKIQQGAYKLRARTVRLESSSDAYTQTYIDAVDAENAFPKSISAMFHGADGAKGKITRCSLEFNMQSGKFEFLSHKEDFESLAKKVPLVGQIHTLTVEQLDRDEAAHQKFKAEKRIEFLNNSFAPV